MTMAGICHKIEKREEHAAYPKQTVGAVLVVELFSGGFPSSPSIRTLTGITVSPCHNLHIGTQLCGVELVVGCGCPFKAHLISDLISFSPILLGQPHIDYRSLQLPSTSNPHVCSQSFTSSRTLSQTKARNSCSKAGCPHGCDYIPRLMDFVQQLQLEINRPYSI